MHYAPVLFPVRFRRLPDESIVAVSETGDYAFLGDTELVDLVRRPQELPVERQAELKSKFLIGDREARGSARLLLSRVEEKRKTVLTGPALHLIVTTLQCEHTCQYCQVSRALESENFAMTRQVLSAACQSIFQSKAPSLTVEFQGGEPLLRFDLLKAAIEEIVCLNRTHMRSIRFVVATTLRQLNEEMCAFFRQHRVYLSTSIDGPAALHNRNRPTPTRDSYERTIEGIALARRLIGQDSVSALLTATRASLEYPEAVVDEYVRLGFNEIFLRSLSSYGFAHRNEARIGYTSGEFARFYKRGFERVLYWNREGVPIREVTAALYLNKLLSPFDAGYVDLQSPTGAGLAALLYNYDGYVYPSDEARMLAEMGDTGLRLGRIGEPLKELLHSEVQRSLVAASLVRYIPGCDSCAYSAFCGPDPVNAYSQMGSVAAPVQLTTHCIRSAWLFDFLLMQLKKADPWLTDLFYDWARPSSDDEACDA